MAENVLYADLNLPQSTRPRTLTVPDVQDSDCTYAEVKVKSQDTNAAADCKSSGKSYCSRKHVAILVVIILILVLAVYLIIAYGPTASSQNSSTTLSHIPEEELGCPPLWRKHWRKCYFFSSENKEKDWEASRGECITMESDLVVIDSREEMSYLLSVSKYDYYLLGLKYFEKKKEWKWINDMKHDPAMFNITRHFSDYECTTIGFGEVGTAPCGGSQTTRNMCEKDATILKRHQKES
ncbi:PREDICTED: C-type lectin domain family 5 member A-like isoform X1 [Pseudopodoces humilis]|uniref:C-type lectin domain family 5 member A-like isoform X1 n=1 Tax=Pseudopodoces humilis TaxID=181119 RepID=UPI0006B6B1A1|nr:PREDICTED: C-type lectin domain family 5 member A-like isoform X1 [Pseudopodoces humilis]